MLSQSLKVLIGWAVVFAVRLIPFRMPNVDPVLASIMPFSARLGYWQSFLFAFLAIGIFDLFTSGLGMWTAITATTYGIVALGSRWWFHGKTPRVRDFLVFGTLAVFFYDGITMMTGPLLFGQSMTSTLIGQVPFTIYHLIGNTVFSFVLSPALYYWVVRRDALEVPGVIHRLRLMWQ